MGPCVAAAAGFIGATPSGGHPRSSSEWFPLFLRIARRSKRPTALAGPPNAVKRKIPLTCENSVRSPTDKAILPQGRACRRLTGTVRPESTAHPPAWRGGGDASRDRPTGRTESAEEIL